MFESQVENYIGKALVEEANGDNQFLNESELAFRVTGMMYADKVKSDGPVSLRSVKGKIGRVRNICDEKGILLIPKVAAKEHDLVKGENPLEVVGWKIATGKDLDYIAEIFMGIKPKDTDTEPVDAPEAEEANSEK